MFAKIMQASGNKACFQFPERSLSYPKIMPASGKNTCSQFPECCLSYLTVTPTACKDTPKERAQQILKLQNAALRVV